MPGGAAAKKSGAVTTVAYRGGVIAADSQVTCADADVGRFGKIAERNGILCGAAGSMALAIGFLDWFRRGMKGEPPPMKKGDSGAEAFIVHDGWVICYDDTGWDRQRAEYYAIGSGQKLALGAMAAGASAEGAVRCAIKHDVYSGGDVTVMRP